MRRWSSATTTAAWFICANCPAAKRADRNPSLRCSMGRFSKRLVSCSSRRLGRSRGWRRRKIIPKSRAEIRGPGSERAGFSEREVGCFLMYLRLSLDCVYPALVLRPSNLLLLQVERVFLEGFEGHVVERPLVGCCK